MTTTKLETPSPRHRWNDIPERRIHAVETKDGNGRTERTCAVCWLVKITVHPPYGDAWREWRTRDGGLWQGSDTPPCLPAKPQLQVASETTSEVIAR
jgi:hypothetical protein